MKIYTVDIETSPNLAFVWGLWKQNVMPQQMVDQSEVLSYAAKRLGYKKTYYRDKRQGVNRMLKGIWKILDEADIVVGHNSDKFDIKILNAAFAKAGMPPPSPYLQIDTMKEAKKKFNFGRNSLSHIAKQLGVKEKGTHSKFPGMRLWLECLQGNEEAWKEMKEYNIRDVLVTEEVYLVLRPWMQTHPNVAAANGRCSCAKCGGDSIQYRGYVTSRVGVVYKRFRCNDCNGWGRMATLDTSVKKRLGRNA